MKNNYWYLFLIPFALWVLDEIFIFKPAFFFIALSFGLLILAFGIRSLVKNNGFKFWPVFVLPPALFFLSLSFYSAIIISQFWIQVIFLLIAWFVFYYLQNIYYYFSFGAPEREVKIRRLMFSGSFLSTFAIAATLYGLPIFLSWPFSLLLLFFLVISIALYGQFYIFSKNITSEQKIFLGLDVLVLTEFAGVLFFLPLNFNILGLLLAIIFYFLILLNDFRVENKLNFKNLKWSVIIGSLIIIFILLTARWL